MLRNQLMTKHTDHILTYGASRLLVHQGGGSFEWSGGELFGFCHNCGRPSAFANDISSLDIKGVARVLSQVVHN